MCVCVCVCVTAFKIQCSVWSINVEMTAVLSLQARGEHLASGKPDGYSTCALLFPPKTLMTSWSPHGSSIMSALTSLCKSYKMAVAHAAGVLLGLDTEGKGLTLSSAYFCVLQTRDQNCYMKRGKWILSLLITWAASIQLSCTLVSHDLYCLAIAR